MSGSSFKSPFLHQRGFQTKAEAFVRRVGKVQGQSGQPAPTVPDQLVQPDLVCDPVSTLATAQFDFADFQYKNGQDILQSGIAPQTAAELQNVQLAQEANALSMLPPEQPIAPQLQTPPQFQNFSANRMRPLDPLSTVPGGPGFQPFGMPKPPGG